MDELEATIESCRKFILAGRIAVASGSVILILLLIGIIQINPSVMLVAIAAVLGGIVAAGSSRSTTREAEDEFSTLEAKRATLVGQLELHVVQDGQEAPSFKR